MKRHYKGLYASIFKGVVQNERPDVSNTAKSEKKKLKKQRIHNDCQDVEEFRGCVCVCVYCSSTHVQTRRGNDQVEEETQFSHTHRSYLLAK